jgi:hypothetical protein
LKTFFVGVSSWILSWDRVHFYPFVMLFTLIFHLPREWKFGICEKTPAQWTKCPRNSYHKCGYKNGVTSSGFLASPGLFRRLHLLSFHSTLQATNGVNPQRSWTCPCFHLKFMNRSQTFVFQWFSVNFGVPT